jgi:hypothetical protein
MMILCLIPKIPHSERERAKHHHCLRNTTYERLERVIQKGISKFYFKKSIKTLE